MEVKAKTSSNALKAKTRKEKWFQMKGEDSDSMSGAWVREEEWEGAGGLENLNRLQSAVGENQSTRHSLCHHRKQEVKTHSNQQAQKQKSAYL